MATKQPGQIEVPYGSVEGDQERDFQGTKQRLKQRFGLDFVGSNPAGDRAIYKSSDGRPWDQRPVHNPDPNSQPTEWQVLGPDRRERFRYDDTRNKNIIPPEQQPLPMVET